jgi:hypothetical protein
MCISSIVFEILSLIKLKIPLSEIYLIQIQINNYFLIKRSFLLEKRRNHIMSTKLRKNKFYQNRMISTKLENSKFQIWIRSGYLSNLMMFLKKVKINEIGWLSHLIFKI